MRGQRIPSEPSTCIAPVIEAKAVTCSLNYVPQAIAWQQSRSGLQANLFTDAVSGQGSHPA
jgi:hypothetical protein